MARPLRVQYAGARYHLMSRGDRRELIFLDEKDRQQFLFTLGQACGKTGWQVHDALAPARLICYPHRLDRPSRSSHASIVEDLPAALTPP